MQWASSLAWIGRRASDPLTPVQILALLRTPVRKSGLARGNTIISVGTMRVSMQNRFRAIIFDLDNTLLDFMELKRRACTAAVTAMIEAGLQMTKDAALKELFALYDIYGIEDHEIFQRFLQKTQQTLSYAILATGIVAYRNVRASYLVPYPRVQQTLEALQKKGLLLGVISDAPRLNAWIRLAALRLAPLFHKVVTFDDTHERKPAPAPFLKMLDALQLPAAACLMVGDWVERDIAGATALGIRTCYARYGAQTKETPKADYIIDDIAELIPIVEKQKF